MKETPLSLCERSSLISNLQCHIRFDGRSFLEMRPIEISFGKDYGCCSVLLGETRVFAQNYRGWLKNWIGRAKVTCEVVEPRPSRPNEGKLSIAVHLSPMAASHFEQGRGNELVDELQHILDRNIKESHCVDVESLCIMAEESVWQLKVDITVLNHAGNLGDACNLAAVAALRHFHRPDVTVEEDGRVTIHTHEERELIPTFLKKIPVCLTYALFMVDKRCITILDPTEKEERVMSGKFVVGLNPHGEITSLLFPGKVCLAKHHIMSCIAKAFSNAKTFAERVMNVVEQDIEKRKSSIKTDGFLNALKSDTKYNKSLLMERVQGVRRNDVSENMLESESLEMKEDDEPVEIKEKPPSAGKKGEDRNEEAMSSSDEEFSPESLRKNLYQIRAERKSKLKATKPKNIDFDDGEMETRTTQLDKNDIG